MSEPGQRTLLTRRDALHPGTECIGVCCRTSRVEVNTTSLTASFGCDVITWGCDEKMPLGQVQAVINRAIAAGTPLHLKYAETGSDDHALVISSREITGEEATAACNSSR